jgi:hypothetical protein
MGKINKKLQLYLYVVNFIILLGLQLILWGQNHVFLAIGIIYLIILLMVFKRFKLIKNFKIAFLIIFVAIIMLFISIYKNKSPHALIFPMLLCTSYAIYVFTKEANRGKFN